MYYANISYYIQVSVKAPHMHTDTNKHTHTHTTGSTVRVTERAHK